MIRFTRAFRSGLFFAGLLTLSAVAPEASARPDAVQEVQSLRRDVMSLQLFQALNLTPQQRTALAPMVNRAVASRQKLEDLKAEAAEREAKALKDALDAFDRSGKLPASVEQNMAAGNSPAIKAAEADLKRQLDQIVAQLTPTQREVLAGFDGEDTQRTGDSANKAYALRQLDRVRVLPDLKFDARMAKLEAAASAPDAPPKFSAQVAEAKQLAFDIRSIPATEWRGEREKLAAEADPQVLKLLQRIAEDDGNSKGTGKTKEQRQIEKASLLLATDTFADAVNTRR